MRSKRVARLKKFILERSSLIQPDWKRDFLSVVIDMLPAVLGCQNTVVFHQQKPHHEEKLLSTPCIWSTEQNWDRLFWLKNKLRTLLRAGTVVFFYEKEKEELPANGFSDAKINKTVNYHI